MNVDVTELKSLLKKLSDRSLLTRVVSISFKNALEYQASFTTKNTKFKKSTGATLGALDTEQRGLDGQIFVDSAKIPYIEPLYYGWERKERMYPVNKRALSWSVNGKRVFAKSVAPAKFAGNPFIEKSFNKNRKNFINYYQREMTEQLQDAL